MFSANENLMLRQHKRRIVTTIESMIPNNDEILDLGTTVMVMEVKCNTPGCVPIETAIIIVFPPSPDKQLIPGLPESQSKPNSKTGSNYKTKILKPMKDVTELDIKECLPPSFIGGLRTMERLCLNARDIMISQITQLFGPTIKASNGGSTSISAGSFAKQEQEEEDDPAAVNDRKLMAQYLQQCLQDYIDNGCLPPEFGKPFPLSAAKETKGSKSMDQADKDGGGGGGVNDTAVAETNATTATSPTTTETTTGTTKAVPSQGNFVIQRKVDDVSNSNKKEESIRNGAASKGLTSVITFTGATATATTAAAAAAESSSSTSEVTTGPSTTIGSGSGSTVLSSIRATQTQNATTKAIVSAATTNIHGGSNNISQLFNREHAPGIRQPGCPCCDPDNPDNVLDKMMTMM